ncbi:MAG: chorismate synthase, partial [Planctomycetota bacterium]
MVTLRYSTAGESHGKGLITVVEGLPAGLAVDQEGLNRTLAMRQKGYGRGGRQAIEKDRAEILTGIKGGKALGTPLAIWIGNKDATLETLPPVLTPRPGHADLPGCLKMSCKDAREILERSSARETAARVAAGGVVQQLLALFGVKVFGHVVAIADVEPAMPRVKNIGEALREKREASAVRCLDPEASEKMKAAIDAAREAGDTVGGVVEAVATGLVPGVGGFDRWESRLDARIAFAVMGIPAVKGVAIGDGFGASRKRGSEVHDEILFN